MWTSESSVHKDHRNTSSPPAVNDRDMYRTSLVREAQECYSLEFLLVANWSRRRIPAMWPALATETWAPDQIPGARHKS